MGYMAMTSMMNSCPWEAIVSNLPAKDGAFVRRACTLLCIEQKSEADLLAIHVCVKVGLLASIGDRLPLLKESAEELYGQIPHFVLALERVR